MADENEKRFNVPPIVFVIAAAVVALVCIIVIISVSNSSKVDDMFETEHAQVTATIINKSITSTDEGETFYIDVEFNAETKEGEFPFTVRMTETSPEFKNLDIGDQLEIYYKNSDPSYCRPVFIYPNNTALYIIMCVIILACAVVIFINTSTILRNIHGYVPKFEKPDEIGYMGDPNAESGLDDKNIDYGATDVFSNNVMDSYVDPFATYTGYEEEDNNGGM